MAKHEKYFDILQVINSAMTWIKDYSIWDEQSKASFVALKTKADEWEPRPNGLFQERATWDNALYQLVCATLNVLYVEHPEQAAEIGITSYYLEVSRGD